MLAQIQIQVQILQLLKNKRSKTKHKPPCCLRHHHDGTVQFTRLCCKGKNQLNAPKSPQMKTCQKLKLHQKPKFPTVPPFLLLRVLSLHPPSPTTHQRIELKSHLDPRLGMVRHLETNLLDGRHISPAGNSSQEKSFCRTFTSTCFAH